MEWFGTSWGAPVCIVCERVATPVGEPCMECEREITLEDSGFIIPFAPFPLTEFVDAVYHRDCFLGNIFGRIEKPN